MTKYQKSKYEAEYLEADKYVIVNDNDDDLKAIVLKLPIPPLLHLIDGYGEPLLEQVFKRHEIPKRLLEIDDQAQKKLLERKNQNKHESVTVYKRIKQFWEIVDEEYDSLEDEIAWLKKIHWHLRYGYWFFCKGKPTYITPWHYHYLNFCHFKKPPYRPQYRDVDRRTEVFEWYAYTTTETFKNLDKNGNAIANEDGTYDMIDTGHRTSFGITKPKRRREGASYKGCMRLKWLVEHTYGGTCTIAADKAGSAKDIFVDNFMTTIKNEPIFMKPKTSSTLGSQSKIIYDSPPGGVNEKVINGSVDYTETGAEGGSDRLGLTGKLDDEVGKNKDTDIRARWNVTRPTMCQGYIIYGYNNHYSTVEEMEGGGDNFKTLCNQSDFYNRVPNSGWTDSGLFLLFIPSPDGMDDFIDPWGYSVIDTPTEDQIKHAPPGNSYVAINKGAKQSLKEDIDKWELLGTPDAIREYKERLRKNPMNYVDCWIGTSGDVGFNTVILKRSMVEAERHPKTDRYDFKDINGKVQAIQNDNGKCVVSNLFLNQGIDNLWTRAGKVYDAQNRCYIESKRPLFPGKLTMGIDTYGYSTKTEAELRTTKSRQSYGSCVVLWEYDPYIETSDDIKEWNSRIPVLTYKHRSPGTKEFCEDMLLIARFYGAMAAVEYNKTNVLEYFIGAGYAGYLKYQENLDGTFKKEPGFWTGVGTKDKWINQLRDFIQDRGHKIVHHELLDELYNFKGPEDFTNKDLSTSLALALMGSKSPYAKVIEKIGRTTIFLDNTPFSRRSY